MKYITKQGFFKLCETIPYWKKQESRWRYISHVIEIIKKANPQNVLELGNMGMNITDSSDTMDIVARKGLTYFHDATNIPLPINDKKYDVFVALQVFEHLDDKRIKQRDVFNEAKRVSKNIIISIPYMWTKSDKTHDKINDKTVLSWSSGKIPSGTIFIKDRRDRKIYYWLDV